MAGCRGAVNPLENSVYGWFNRLADSLSKGMKGIKVRCIDGDENRNVFGQRPSDHRPETAALDFLLAELVDDEKAGFRRADAVERTFDKANRLFETVRIETASARHRAQVLTDPHQAIRGKHMQDHVTALARRIRDVLLDYAGQRPTFVKQFSCSFGEQQVGSSAPLGSHVSQHPALPPPPLEFTRHCLQDARRKEKHRMIPDLPILPNPVDPRLTRRISGTDQTGSPTEISVVEERPLTIFLNSQEIVTAMTIGDYVDYLALGFLRNQGMLRDDDVVTAIDYDDEIETVVVRTERQTSYEDKLKRKTQTSGCAVGTVFGDMMEGIEELTLPDAPVRTSWLYELARAINTTPSLYLEAGAIHGTVLCQEDKPLVFMEDVGRHNAVDKITGFMFRHKVPGHDKILYTTGRLTSEMVIKTALSGIPVLASRSGFTAWGVEIARQVGLTLIGRLRGHRFICLSGEERLIRDVDPTTIPEESARHRRKGAENS